MPIRFILGILLLLLLSFSQLFSDDLIKKDDEIQISMFAKFFPIVIHPMGERLNQYYKYNLSDSGWLARGEGGIGGIDFYNNDRSLGIRLMGGLYKDCAGLPSGFYHLGFRQRIINYKKHNLNWGIGPTYIYRESWSRFEGYKGHWLLREHGDTESAFILWGGEFEYNYEIEKNFELSATIMPAIPAIVMMGFGLKIWF